MTAAQGPETLDLEAHLVADLERRRDLLAATAPQLGQAAATTRRTGRQQVTGHDDRVERGVVDHLGEGPVHVGQQVAADQLVLAIVPSDVRAAVELEVAAGVDVRRELVGRHDPRTDRGREVLALGRAEPDLHLA